MYIKKLELCFNSTLVQLKAITAIRSPSCLKSFNSTLVQLKGIRSNCPGFPQTCFNSTLVQLKEITTAPSALFSRVSILP